MSKLSRRSFFRLGSPLREARTPAQPPEAPKEIGALPPVISWLRELTEEPALPARSAHAPVLRPPGAVAEADFLARCTKCGDCASACPHAAIGSAPLVFRDAAGTPMIDASNAPCRLCEDFPCVAACSTEALTTEGDRMGHAWIQELDCMESSGLACGACIEQCPVEGAIVRAPKTPMVQRSVCVGCGVCHYVCPAPINAIAILPNAKRMTPPQSRTEGR